MIAGAFGLLHRDPLLAVDLRGGRQLFAWSAIAGPAVERFAAGRVRTLRIAASIGLAWSAVIVSVILAGLTNILISDELGSAAVEAYVLKPFLAISMVAVVPATLLGVVHRALSDRRR